ncbi:hypothetical protein CYMTET_11686 [Cymbomonas tetramitiformis]|uniref:Uncharacterized protein n=1 Tax=Cymbomonas tetramitiformis TaxID=36881 RepID=A0AAE0LD79_9CHLO|nr:hypothetical protein CYMTET_11686 [Cymbomonas tetramitiformis]
MLPQLDCSAATDTRDVLIYLEADFDNLNIESAQLKEDLSKRVRWNVCSKSNGLPVVCWFEKDQRLDGLKVRQIEKFSLTPGEWHVRVSGDPTTTVRGRVMDSSNSTQYSYMVTYPAWDHCLAVQQETASGTTPPSASRMLLHKKNPRPVMLDMELQPAMHHPVLPTTKTSANSLSMVQQPEATLSHYNKLLTENSSDPDRSRPSAIFNAITSDGPGTTPLVSSGSADAPMPTEINTSHNLASYALEELDHGLIFPVGRRRLLGTPLEQNSAYTSCISNPSSCTGKLQVTNGLSGTIPTEIGTLVHLTWLGHLGRQLTGTIPTEIGKLTSVVQLLLQINKLTGPLPTEVGCMTRLSTFSLYTNSLESLPTEIGALTSLNGL